MYAKHIEAVKTEKKCCQIQKEWCKIEISVVKRDTLVLHFAPGLKSLASEEKKKKKHTHTK